MSSINVTLGLWQDRPPMEALETAAAADRLGFGELWIGEMATFDAFALATAIGLKHKRITPAVGPFAVSVRTPATIAMGAATVSATIGRPVNVALGASSDVVVGEWHGQPRDRPAVRLRESALIVRGLLEGEKVDRAGETTSSHGYHLRLDPPGSSLTIAAFGPKAIEVAATCGDRVLLNMVTVPAAQRLCAQIAAAAHRAGRPTPTIAAWLSASVDPTADDLAQMIRSKTGYLAAPGYRDIFIEAGFGDLVEFARTRPHPKVLRAAMPDAEIAAVTCLTGGKSEVAARIEAYVAAGIDEVCVVPTTAGDPGGIRTLTALSSLL